MKRIKGLAVVAVFLLSACMFTGCSVYTQTVPVQTNYSNPQWAPPYYAGARYYYLPDIECYYDLSSNDFIYLNDGMWRYSRTIPGHYSSFDLDNCFSVVLSVEVYRPWLHHQYYVSHYPRYYYRDYYDHSNIPYVRGFNENRKSAIYWRENERQRARKWDDQNLRNNRNFKYPKEELQRKKENDRQSVERVKVEDRTVNRKDVRRTEVKVETREDANSRNNRTQRESDNTKRETGNRVIDSNKPTRATETPNTSRQQSDTRATETDKTQKTNYYGRTIGNPVKVERQMQQKTERAAPAKVERAAPERKATEKVEKTSTERTTKTNNGRR